MNKYPEYSNLILTHALKNGCTVGAIKMSLLKNKANILKGRVCGKFKKTFSKGIGSNTTRDFEIPDIFSAEKKIDELKREGRFKI